MDLGLEYHLGRFFYFRYFGCSWRFTLILCIWLSEFELVSSWCVDSLYGSVFVWYVYCVWIFFKIIWPICVMEWIPIFFTIGDITFGKRLNKREYIFCNFFLVTVTVYTNFYTNKWKLMPPICKGRNRLECASGEFLHMACMCMLTRRKSIKEVFEQILQGQ